MFKSTMSVIALALLFASCGKDENSPDAEVCVECTTKSTTTVTPDNFDMNDYTEVKQEFCWDRAQIAAYEKAGSITTTSTSGGYTVKIVNETKCVNR
jgi:PBP1b-binding outer membrane lipoprotein LpoB